MVISQLIHPVFKIGIFTVFTPNLLLNTSFSDRLFISIQVLMADKNEEVIDEKKLTEESVESNLRPLY